MSLTSRILLLVLLALAPALAIQGYNEYALRSSRDAAIRVDALATGRGVAETLGQVTDGIHQALEFAAEDLSVKARDPVACTAYLRRAAARMPSVIAFALATPDGRVVCNSRGAAPGAYTMAGRDYHRLALAQGDFVMGGYVRGIATGRDSVHFAQPLLDEEGGTIGVLSAALDLEWLANRLRLALRFDSTTVTMVDANGLILVRYPDPGSWIGKPLPPDRAAVLTGRGEGVRVAGGFDGRERVLAAVRPPGVASDTWLIVGRDRETAFADVDQATWRGVTLILLGAMMAVVAALLAGRAFIRRPLERLLRAASSWQAGDLAVRTGLTGGTEFGRLGEKLDAMAGSLQRHETDLREELRRGRVMQERQVTMLHELNHRVKNTLATVQALARQSTRGGEASGEQLEARILALSKTHDLLTREDWSGAPLREVLEAELGPYRGGDSHVVVEGPDVGLSPRQVLSLGMTLHELATNAAKYGSLCRPGGLLRVSWRVATDGGNARRLHLDWVESGGPIPGASTRKGFGTRLITVSIERELDGSVRLNFAPEGLRCVITVPMVGATADYMSPLAPPVVH
jgi:two-component sensor histidine kinase